MGQVNYLKVGKATDLSGKDYKFYRFLETLPGFISMTTELLNLQNRSSRPLGESLRSQT